MLVLAVDTATEACLAAVGEVDAVGGQIDDSRNAVRLLAARAPVDAKRHGELLAPLISEVLDEAGARPADLGGVVVGLGPGPFTSLRVGVVTGASLADALGVRAVGVCTLDAIAGAVPESAHLVVATDARRKEVYWARYAHGDRMDGPAVERPAVLAQTLATSPEVRVVGSGAALYPELGQYAPGESADTLRYPSAEALLGLGLSALLAAQEPGPLVPLYLRRPDAVPPGAPKAAAHPARAGAQ